MGCKKVLPDLWNHAISHHKQDSFKVLNSIKTIQVHSMYDVCLLNTWPESLTKLDYDYYMLIDEVLSLVKSTEFEISLYYKKELGEQIDFEWIFRPSLF